ncbi:GAF sensor signal transduction histidine kinase [Calothrix sp. NIES-4071]|nr:GAF sensor signal transduction histidine kinase [Calothrix sp. NIES-4071]BAZ55408.1 GAF sensor signal transduction histidine kinase [Calothrix sp. NIES-4105]
MTHDFYWQQMRTLEVLSSLSHRNGDLSGYLKEIACGVNELISTDWSVVTICQQGFGEVLASSINLDRKIGTYAVHGQLSGTVIETGCSLVVEDTKNCTEYGQAPEGYQAYLGVPLRTSQNQVIGTICSFHRQPRDFSQQEVNIVELFAERAATAIDNYYLYKQQTQFNQVLEAEVARRTEELKAAQAQLVEQERLAAIGEFAACIIHEIRNPFTTVKMGLNYFSKLDLSEAAKLRLSLALDEGNRLERLLQEILLYAKPQALQLEPIYINQFITKIVESLHMPEAEGKYIDFISLSTDVQILGDQDKLKQVLINVIRNAYEAVAVGNTIKLDIIESNTNQVVINIQNSGAVIVPEVLSKLTQPFYSTKPDGTGLGLAITKRIVEAHGGKLVITSSLEEGTIVSITLAQR